jgi:hypothetical protein
LAADHEMVHHLFLTDRVSSGDHYPATERSK